LKNIPTDDSEINRLKTGIEDGIDSNSKPPLIDVIDPNAITPIKVKSYKIRKFYILIRFYKGKAKYFFNFI
jgi:hypothetical protein